MGHDQQNCVASESRYGHGSRAKGRVAQETSEKSQSGTHDGRLGRPEVKWQLVTESQSKRVDDDQSDKLLQQMALLCESVKMLGTQMREGLETEGARRKEDYKSLEEKMSARMGEGFKNEDNARKLVQNELAVMKDEIKNLKMGSGSTLSSEASTGVGLGSGTFARPPPLTSRWNEIIVPRKWSSKDGSPIALRAVFKGSQTMRLRYL